MFKNLWYSFIYSFDKKNEVRDQYFHVLGNVVDMIKKYQKKSNEKIIENLVSYRSQIDILKNLGYFLL